MERTEARLKLFSRKQETREKIQWGGLIKKAGLGHEHEFVLLGLLLEAKEKLGDAQFSESIRSQWAEKGKFAFFENDNVLMALKEPLSTSAQGAEGFPYSSPPCVPCG
jgi:hypothetical protein